MPDKEETVALSQYLEWLKSITDQRVNSSKPVTLQEMLVNNPEPVVKTHNEEALCSLFLNTGLSIREKLIFLLSISPYYIPGYLNSIAMEQGHQNLLALSRSQINGNFIPTVETAVFILAGKHLPERNRCLKLFVDQAPLIKEGIIELPAASQNDPFTSLRLLPAENTLRTLLTGESNSPEFSKDFPATLLETDYQWEDLILPYDTSVQIKEVKEWVEFEKLIKNSDRQQAKFKFGCKSLFHGPPGTGKTLAATLLGKHTGKKVYRIDLSAIVSKYIGETEKNLSRVFDRASNGDWILFFDEADALFGKRGSTNNAHDRYANQEVSYLLQRFETYEGLSILASNYINNIDRAFYRRFDNIVEFKKPEHEERLQLWKKFLPEGYVFDPEVDIEKTAYKIEINGAAIYNIMRHSYMKAVLRGDNIIKGQDMQDSLRKEKRKEGKVIT